MYYCLHLLKEFEELDCQTLETIVRRDGLRIENETEVLTALIRWSIFECHRRQMEPSASNQRHVLGHLLWHVRFSAMSSDELLRAAPILQSLAPEDFATIGSNELNRGIHYSVIKPRMYLSSKAVTQTANRSVNNNGSCEKTCLAEKFFVCLACIFE